MKTSIHPITIIIFSVVILFTSISSAQIIYEDQLETVYLNENAEEVVYTNSFSNFNTNLITTDHINFKVEIQRAKENNSYLLFLSERSNLEILTKVYLKTLRKGANRSPDTERFESFIRDEFPELINQFKKDNTLKQLYIISRKNTFNGKIDALPSVL